VFIAVGALPSPIPGVWGFFPPFAGDGCFHGGWKEMARGEIWDIHSTVSGKGLQEKRASEYYAGKHCLWQKMVGKTLIDFPVGIPLYAPSLMGFKLPDRSAGMNARGNENLQRPDTGYPIGVQNVPSAGGYRAPATPYPQRSRYPENFNIYRSPGADTLKHSQRGNNLIIT